MTDYEALLRSVVDRPDDDTPRLVLADWCDDQGDPGLAARAAFIRAQVKLAEAGGRVPSPGEFQCRKPKTRQIVVDDAVVYAQPTIEHVYVYTGPCGKCDWCALTREAAEAFAAMPLEQKYIRGGDGIGEWIVPFGEPRQWARGFPEVCRSMHSTFWRVHHAAILAAAPIRRVELVDVPEVIERHVGLSIRYGLGDEGPFYTAYEVSQLAHRLKRPAPVMRGAETAAILLADRWPKVEFVPPYGEVPFRGGYEAWAAQPHVRAENERRLREGREGAEAARRLAAAVDRLPRPPAN